MYPAGNNKISPDQSPNDCGASKTDKALFCVKVFTALDGGVDDGKSIPFNLPLLKK